MSEQPTTNEFERAIVYFNCLKPSTKISSGTTEDDEYHKNICIAHKAGIRLEEYGRRGLEFLFSNGLKIHESVIVGTSQKGVEIFAIASSACGTDRSDIQDAMRVLSAYREIQQYEQQVENYRKLKVVDEAMKKFLGK